jgi:hypothetical protein
MRLFIAATVAASLFATNLLAADLAAPLAAGKPAGVQKAQDSGIAPIWYIVGGIAAIGGIVAVVGDNSGPVATTPPTTG